jgi:hypothetical protein
LDDIIHSGLKYGSNSDIDGFLRDVGYVEHDRLNLDRFECADLEKCMERVLTESDTTFVATKFTLPLASVKYLMKICCALWMRTYFQLTV